MLMALTFAHFSSELLLKEQMIIPVKKTTLNNAGDIDAKLIDFSEICQKNPAKSAVFYRLFLGEVSPRNFPWNRPIFLRIFPWKSVEIWLFSAKIPRNRPNLRLKIPRNFAFFSAKYQMPRRRNVNTNRNGGRRSTFAGNSALLPTDVIDFAMLPAQKLLAGKNFIVRYHHMTLK